MTRKTYTPLDADGCPVSCPSCPHRHDLYEAFVDRRDQVRALLGRVRRLEDQVRAAGLEPIE